MTTTSTSYNASSSSTLSMMIVGVAKGGRRAAQQSTRWSLFSNNGRGIGFHQNHYRFFSRRRRCVDVQTRAQKEEKKDKFARDTIDLSKRKLGPGTAAPVKVTFLGANGSSVTVDCPTDQYILDAALDAGLELPFTCRGGICGCARASRCFFPSLFIIDFETRKILKLTYYYYRFFLAERAWQSAFPAPRTNRTSPTSTSPWTRTNKRKG
tara:strand:- start:310 stop:939 length:630 start_codon:yes stop_codon:yes gene_type:complete